MASSDAAAPARITMPALPVLVHVRSNFVKHALSYLHDERISEVSEVNRNELHIVF